MSAPALCADYRFPTRHFMPRAGDVVRLVDGDKSFLWHGTVESVLVDKDSASPDGLTVEMIVAPHRVFSPLHEEFRAKWSSAGDTIPHGEDGRMLVAEHAVEVCCVNLCSPSGESWVRYQTSDKFGHRRL